MFYDMDEDWKDKEIKQLKWIIPLGFVVICFLF